MRFLFIQLDLVMEFKFIISAFGSESQWCGLSGSGRSLALCVLDGMKNDQIHISRVLLTQDQGLTILTSKQYNINTITGLHNCTTVLY